jgi:hypothetical protein
MMVNNFPNELIREILLLVFDIPDEMFRDLSETSPFSRPSHLSTSSVLGVCKRWMNVGIPLLYRVVVLRSKAQACALRHILRKHNELGVYIEKLRVEGGYGPAMGIIINAAPNITDLCISFDIQESDSVSGLCCSLASINPCCVVVLPPVVSWISAPLVELLTTLKVCLGSWTNLVSQICCSASSSATEI